MDFTNDFNFGNETKQLFDGILNDEFRKQYLRKATHLPMDNYKEIQLDFGIDEQKIE